MDENAHRMYSRIAGKYRARQRCRIHLSTCRTLRRCECNSSNLDYVVLLLFVAIKEIQFILQIECTAKSCEWNLFPSRSLHRTHKQLTKLRVHRVWDVDGKIYLSKMLQNENAMLLSFNIWFCRYRIGFISEPVFFYEVLFTASKKWKKKLKKL